MVGGGVFIESVFLGVWLDKMVMVSCGGGIIMIFKGFLGVVLVVFCVSGVNVVDYEFKLYYFFGEKVLVYFKMLVFWVK